MWVGDFMQDGVPDIVIAKSGEYGRVVSSFSKQVRN
jgi:hypothetical protein